MKEHMHFLIIQRSWTRLGFNLLSQVEISFFGNESHIVVYLCSKKIRTGHINQLCVHLLYHAEQFLFHLVVAANYCFWILGEASQPVLCFVLH